MLIIVLEDNGDFIKKKKSIQSLRQQSIEKYRLEIISKEKRGEFLEGIQDEDGQYYSFLCSGSELLPGVIDKISAVIENHAMDWYYCDERVRTYYKNDVEWEEITKPDYGVIGFVSHLYTGQAVIFSAGILKKICYADRDDSFDVFVKKLTIEASLYADGFHIEEPLILRNPAADPGGHRTDLEQGMRRLLDARNIPLAAAGDPDTQINYLYCMKKEELCTWIVVCDDPGQELFWGNYYRDSSDNQKIITVSFEGSWGKTWNRGAAQADEGTLIFITAGWQPLESFKRRQIEGFARLSHVGAVSPRLCGKAGEDLYTGAAKNGHGFCTALKYEDSEGNDFAEGIREISVPAWQYFAVRKELWERAGGFTEENISADFCAADFSLCLNQLGYVGLYCGQIRVFAVKKPESFIQRGFLYLLERWKSGWEKDPYFTKAMCRKLLERKSHNTVVYFPEREQVLFHQGKRVLILSHELSMTGAPVVLIYALRILKKAGYQPVVLSPKDGVLRNDMLKEGVPVLIDEDIGENDRWMCYAAEFDLIIVNTVVPFACVEQLRGFAVPVIWWIHDAREGYEHYLRHVLPDDVGKNINVYCVSDYAKNVLEKYRPKYASGILRYGLPDLSGNMDAREDLPGPEERPVFLTVGTLESRKGQDILLEAIRLLPEEYRKRCGFCFIGAKKSEKMGEELDAMIGRYPDHIQWIPFLNRNEIFHAYRRAAAVICCSRDDPLPTFMAETMMLSGICICSENTGTAALIDHGKNGFLYHNNSAEELAECIVFVLKNRDRLDEIRKNARDTYVQEFSLAVFEKHFLQIVEESMEMERKNGYGHRR